MTKAVSWTNAGGGFDAREAAREAARRQGKSLGEWLHGVIAENAGDSRQGSGQAGQPSSRERIEAVTARLERMGATRERATRSQSKTGRREAEDNVNASARRRLQLVDEDDRDMPPAQPRAAHRARADADTDDALEQALATMQRRTQRSERRTDDALASLAQMMETSEQRRQRERAGVESLADKLADIEARLSSRDETPIKGTLARLEARLEQIGRRSEAESGARALAAQAAARPTAPTPDPEPIRRLEEKLNAVLDALATGRAAQTSPIALAAAQDRHDLPQVELPLRRRRLGDAIAEIAERQRMLEVPAPRHGRTAAIAGEGGPLSARLDEISRGMTAPRVARAPEEDLGSDTLRREIATMAERIRDVAPRGAVAAVESRITDLAKRLDTRLDATDPRETHAAIGELRAQMRSMDGRLQEVRDLAAQPAGPDMSTLEQLVRDLGLRIEAVQAPGADTQAVDALQRQIGTLAARLETTETGLAALGSLDRSMRDLFAHLEETRAHAETAAAHAASEAVRTAVAERGFDRPAPRADVAVLKAMQEDADLRTRATLDVVHEALDKIVDRLGLVEHGLTEARVARATRDEAIPDMPSRRAPAPDLTVGMAEPLVEPRAGARVRKPLMPEAGADRAGGQADFIAAARRAAHAAQTDPSVVALRRPAVPVVDEPVLLRAGLAAKSRDYVASHKRPVLMALAAVLVVAATMALMQALPFGAGDTQVAEAPTVPARIAAYTAPARPAPTAETRPAETRRGPLASPPQRTATPAIAARIPGSDPVVTGSIPSLPSFAARAAAPAPAAKPPTLPAGLTAAADGGDGAAQYTLAAAYAEGRAVPRDLALAAKLYAKAADKGIVPAQYRLGALYEKGLGVAQDKARARNLYQQAADAGSPRAMHNLAVLLADGDGKPDYEGAATWFRRAAQLGVHDSEFNLAILLARGLGVQQSLVQSYQWFAIAATHGDTDAAAKRDEVATKLSASELSVAKALAAAFHAREPDAAAVDVTPPPGGWDGAAAPARLNSARSKISSL